MTDSELLFSLLRFEICQTAILDETKNQISPDRLPAIYKLSKSHDLAHLVADSLQKNELLPKGTEAEKRFLQERNLAIYRYEQLSFELGEICGVLEEAKIEYIPLKGSVIRVLYPEPWLRTSCDIDILVRENDLDRATKILSEKLRYTVGEKDSHDVSLFSESGVHLELHFKLVDLRVTRRGENVLLKIWEHLELVKGYTYQKKLTDEMFYFFHIAHMAKHFHTGGCGIRPFMDLWLLNHKVEYSEEKRQTLLEEGKLAEFEFGVKSLSEVWFGNSEHSDLTKELEDYVLRGGVYGNMKNSVAIQYAKKGGRVKTFFSRIFVPYDVLLIRYPSLEKHKWLMPIYQIRRWGRLLLKGKAKASIQELKTGANVSEEQQLRAERLLRDLGL